MVSEEWPYSETSLERPLLRDHMSWRTTYSWQKVPHFSTIDPVTKDHRSWETIFYGQWGGLSRQVLLYFIGTYCSSYSEQLISQYQLNYGSLLDILLHCECNASHSNTLACKCVCMCQRVWDASQVNVHIIYTPLNPKLGEPKLGNRISEIIYCWTQHLSNVIV